MKVNRSTEDGGIARPYNSYNIFFALERVLIIEEKRSHLGYPSGGTQTSDFTCTIGSGYENLELPPLPPRYAHLASVLPDNWCNPGKNVASKRKHKKTHGGEFLLCVCSYIIVP